MTWLWGWRRKEGRGKERRQRKKDGRREGEETDKRGSPCKPAMIMLIIMCVWYSTSDLRSKGSKRKKEMNSSNDRAASCPGRRWASPARLWKLCVLFLLHGHLLIPLYIPHLLLKSLNLTWHGSPSLFGTRLSSWKKNKLISKTALSSSDKTETLTDHQETARK